VKAQLQVFGRELRCTVSTPLARRPPFASETTQNPGDRRKSSSASFVCPRVSRQALNPKPAPVVPYEPRDHERHP